MIRRASLEASSGVSCSIILSVEAFDALERGDRSGSEALLNGREDIKGTSASAEPSDCPWSTSA